MSVNIIKNRNNLRNNNVPSLLVFEHMCDKTLIVHRSISIK